ncbi:hypothetical protein EW145_g3265 [Phellinidium pouzarii]|uniref:Uncharacterized protein n=1 Tax=Phellinidium pouzarii TaxID=167371 RepID=A0A4V3XCX9_9AGAM|nr:hypothetical protein EW145_g3265 [Phellinidium pouzarii]
MQTATYRPLPISAPPPAADPIRVSVAHLLAHAHGIPCTAAAQAFVQLVQPTSRFGVALDILLPLLSGRSETPRRILAAHILYFLYASHPIAINPFRSAFVEVFLREREGARVEAERGGVSENEQLVWVLWKILKGDGNDLGPYSPTTLAHSPLPPKLRASQLTVDETLTREDDYLNETSQILRQQPSSIFTSGISPAPSAARTPIENGSGSKNSDEYMSDLIEQGMRLLLAACQRVLTLHEQRMVASCLPRFVPQSLIALHSLPPLIALNPALGHPLIVSLLSNSPSATRNTYFARMDVLEVLRQLPPTLPSFDVIGRLLRDPTSILAIDRNERAGDVGADQYTNSNMRTTIADLTRTEILGAFIFNAIGWVERSEREAIEGLISDDRAGKGVQNLCRFYNSLIKLGLVDPSSDADSVEMVHFALAHAQYEDANALYRVLVLGKF